MGPLPTLILSIFRRSQGQNGPSLTGAYRLPWAPVETRLRHPAKSKRTLGRRALIESSFKVPNRYSDPEDIFGRTLSFMRRYER